MQQLGYSEPDARTVALNNIIAIARSCQMILNLLDSWTKGDELIRQIIPQLLGLQPITQEGVIAAGNGLKKTAKLSFVTLSQFQIENALRNIHRELGLLASGTGFYRLANSVLTDLGFSAADLDALAVPARIRNSLHKNGIHHKQHPNETSVILLRGVTYEFRDGCKVSCADWEHIANALECSLEVLGKVFHHPKVISIPDPMMDEYAWEIETAP